MSARPVEGAAAAAVFRAQSAAIGVDYPLLEPVSPSASGSHSVNGERIGPTRLHRMNEQLSERDWRVLHSLREHQFLLTSQLQRLHFAAHRSEAAGIRACVRALDRLRGLGLVVRLQRRIGGRDSGSRGFVWCLDPVGNRLLARQVDSSAPRRRHFEPTPLFLEHTLAVAELRVQLEEAARAGPIELERVETEPTCWRDYVGPHGQPATLKPDLALVTAAGDYEDHYFVELDRGTESIRTVLVKCAQYEAYRRSGREQAAHGVFPLVVWSVPDEKRRDRIENELDSARDPDTGLFRVVTHERAVPLLTGQAPTPPTTTDTSPDDGRTVRTPDTTNPHERRTKP